MEKDLSQSQGNKNLEPSQEGNNHDDGEHFELNVLGIVKIKCKRVTVNVIIVIVFVVVAVLFGWLMQR